MIKVSAKFRHSLYLHYYSAWPCLSLYVLQVKLRVDVCFYIRIAFILNY